MHGRGVSRARAASSADYKDEAAVSDATVDKHLRERYLPFSLHSKGPAQREEHLNNLTPGEKRKWCELLQPVHRSARNLEASRTPCGMDCSSCRATRCCGMCGLSKVGYLHDDCDDVPDIMKCQRCEQMTEGLFRTDVDELSKKYKYLLSRRTMGDGSELRQPHMQRVMGYMDNASWMCLYSRLCVLERRVEVDGLLTSFGLPLQVERLENDDAREKRLASAMLSNLQMCVWADGTPICNRPFQAHTCSLMCASKL